MSPSPAPPDKLCATCGRPFSWRKKWAADWDHVRFCSDRCRRHRPGPVDLAIENALLDNLKTHPRGRWVTLEPRDLGSDVPAETLRQALRRLAARGVVQLGQNGRPVSSPVVKGPLSVRLVSSLEAL